MSEDSGWNGWGKRAQLLGVAIGGAVTVFTAAYGIYHSPGQSEAVTFKSNEDAALEARVRQLELDARQMLGDIRELKGQMIHIMGPGGLAEERINRIRDIEDKVQEVRDQLGKMRR